jgi:hypothetical protein
MIIGLDITTTVVAVMYAVWLLQLTGHGLEDRYHKDSQLERGEAE